MFQDSSATVSGLSVNDLDVGTNQLQFDFSASHGTLSLVVSGVTTNGNSISVRADLTSINAALGNNPVSTFHYTPDPGYSGADMLVLMVNDLGDGGVNTPATFTKTITVLVDSAPVLTAPAPAQTTPFAPTLPLSFQVTDTDDAIGTVSVTGSSSDPSIVPNGNIVVTGAGNTRSVVVTPAGGIGTAIITLTATDPSSNSSSVTFSVVVVANTPPTLSGLSDQIIFEDTASIQTFTISDNETPGNLVLSGISTDQTIVPNSGIICAPNGSSSMVTVTPASHQSGTVSIKVTVTDSGGLSSNANFNLTIIHINHAPILSTSLTSLASIPANSGSGPFNPGTLVSTFASPLISDIDTLDSKGIAITGIDDTNGAWRYSTDAGSTWWPIAPLTSNANALLLTANTLNKIQFVPITDFAGTASFTFRAWDGSNLLPSGTMGADASATGGNSPYSVASCTTKITINPINTQPSFILPSNSVTVNEDSGTSAIPNFATNISPGIFASESSQVLTFTITGNTNPGLFTIAPSIASNGTLTFAPAANANGTSTLSVVLKDNGGTAFGGSDTSGVQTFSILINPVNDPPSFTIPNSAITVIDGSNTSTISGFATQISAGPPDESWQGLNFIVTNVSNPAIFSGTPAITSNGNLSFTEIGLGSSNITIVLKDTGGTAFNGSDTSQPQTFSITVVAPNTAPIFTLPNATVTVNEDAGPQSKPGFATSISAGSNPTENTQNLTFLVTSCTNPALFSVQPAVAADGTLSFQTAPDANGTACFSLSLMDDGGTAFGGQDTSAAQLVTVNVTPVNDPPSFTLSNTPIGALENSGPNTIPMFATSISAGPPDEQGQTLQFLIQGNTNPALLSSAPTIDTTGTLTFTPAPNTTGTTTITVALMDNGGTANGGLDTSGPQTFTITIGANNTPPSFTITQDPVLALENTPFLNPTFLTSISPGLNAFESGQSITFTITSNSNPSLFVVPPQILYGGLSTNANLLFLPALNQVGTATITIQAQDNGGTALGGIDTSAPQTFTIVIQPVNQAPSFTLPSSTVIVGINSGPVSKPNVAANISAGPPNEITQTVMFTLTSNSNPGLFAVAPQLSPTGTLTFTPQPNIFGSATVKVLLQDDGGTANGGVDTSAPQFLTIVVAAAPVATNGAISVAASGTGSGNFTAVDALNQPPLPLTFSIVTNGSLGKATIVDPASGAFSYTPNPGASGLDTVVFVASNGYVNSNLATEFIFITNPTINSPSAVPNPATLTKHSDGTYVDVTFVSFGSDTVNAQTLQYTWDFGDGAFGSGSSTVHRYVTAGNFTAQVTVLNSNGQRVSASLTVTVFAGEFGTGPDSDGDGFSDTLETAYGSNPQSAASKPPGDPTNPQKLNIERLDIGLAFGKTRSDAITLMVLTPFPANIAFKGQRLAVDIGGNVFGFTLDENLRAKTPAGTLVVSIDHRFKVFRFLLTLKKGAFASSLAAYGLTSSATKKASPTVPVTVLFGDMAFTAEQTLSYQSTGKTGRAKVP